MTLTELLANEELRRHEFPVSRERIFLAHGGDCPLPRRVAEAIAKYAHDSSTAAQEKCAYPAIGKALHERNILFCLDAIQTLGAFPTTVEHVDYLAADAHKWLLGPCGAGLLYVRRNLQEGLTPPIYGWNNVRCPNYVAQEQIVFRNTSQKYEAGTHNLLGIVGMVAAMELISELGVENIARDLLRKRTWLIPALQAKGYT